MGGRFLVSDRVCVVGLWLLGLWWLWYGWLGLCGGFVSDEFVGDCGMGGGFLVCGGFVVVIWNFFLRRWVYSHGLWQLVLLVVVALIVIASKREREREIIKKK